MNPHFVKAVFFVLSHLVSYVSAEWKNFIEVNVPEGGRAGKIYDGLPLLTNGNKYLLLYAQKVDSFDKVGLFKVSPFGVITTVQPLIYEKGKPNLSLIHI